MKMLLGVLSSVLWISVCVSAADGPSKAEQASISAEAEFPDAGVFSLDITQAPGTSLTQIPVPVNADIREAVPDDEAVNLTPEELRIVENANRALALALAGRGGDRINLMPETPLSREYAVLAAEVNHKESLDILLRAMSGICLNNPGFKQEPWTHARAMMRGIMSYLSGEGGTVKFQERHDLTLHFAYAAYLDMAYGYTLARYTAVRKEKQDSQQAGNFCDYDDYAASMLGVNWAGKKTSELKTWLNKWETGERKLDDIPPLQFGREPPGRWPQSAKLLEIDAFSAKIMQ